MDQIAFTLATILLGLMLIDCIATKIAKIKTGRKISKGIDQFVEGLIAEIKKEELEEDEEDEEDERN